MHKLPGPLSLFVFLAAVVVPFGAQTSGKAPAVTAEAAQHATSLAESGHCSEALPSLTRTVAHLTDKELQKRAGLAGVRCATLLQQTGPLLDFIRILNQQFP